MRIGVDIGISATKIVVLDEAGLLKTELIEHTLSVTELEEYLFDKKLVGNHAIAVTGVGSKSIGAMLFGMPVRHVDEFEANAKAARWFCHEDRFIVVSMGSGTSFVLIDGTESKHLGGSALGGATLYGLFSLLLPGVDYREFRSLAECGDLSRIDQQIGDVCTVALPNLPLDTTATNFGKAGRASSAADIAAGLVNMVIQNIGVMANLAGSGRGITTYLMIGRMTTLPKCREIFDRLETLYKIRIVVPDEASFMTAIGASLVSVID